MTEEGEAELVWEMLVKEEPSEKLSVWTLMIRLFIFFTLTHFNRYTISYEMAINWMH